MDDPVLHVIAVNPAVILSEVLSGDRPGAGDVRGLPFITFAELMARQWPGGDSLVTGIHVENFLTVKANFVRSLEKAELAEPIVERFRYVQFTSHHEVPADAAVHEERIEMSALIDQHHSSYGTGFIHDAVEIPELDDAFWPWDQDDNIF